MTNDISRELAKRISRRQFLFGGKNSGGGGSETGVLGTVLGVAGVGVGVMALGSPGPTAQSFQDAYVQKKPNVASANQQITEPTGYNSTVNSLLETVLSSRTLSERGYGVLGPLSSGKRGAVYIGVRHNAPVVRYDFDSSDPEAGPSTLDAMMEFVDPATGAQGNFFRFMHDYGSGGIGPVMFVGIRDTGGVWGGISERLMLEAGLVDSGGGISYDDGLGPDTQYVGGVGGLPEPGAQVGLPTGIIGSRTTVVRGNHRHAFSGRFLGAQATLPLGQGAGLPFNFARVKINNNWTLRRIWVYAQVGPTGGTETYGIVNAAGALQGTAVVLPAGAGAQQAESALQVTNLTGGTLYYVAQTAIGAGWAAGSTNTEVGFEYTMNV